MSNKALIIVDFQEDFLPSGALGVPDGHRAYLKLWTLMDTVDVIVFTRDWHPADHCSFAEGTPAYRDGSWPVHCVQDTEGAEIDEPLWESALATGKPVLLVNKGFDKDREAYSGFDGIVVQVFNNDTLNVALAGTPLRQALHYFTVNEVKIGGLALDYCVLATAIDARSSWGNTTVYLNATRPVAYLTGVAAVAKLAASGVRLNESE